MHLVGVAGSVRTFFVRFDNFYRLHTSHDKLPPCVSCAYRWTDEMKDLSALIECTIARGWVRDEGGFYSRVSLQPVHSTK